MKNFERFTPPTMSEMSRQAAFESRADRREAELNEEAGELVAAFREKIMGLDPRSSARLDFQLDSLLENYRRAAMESEEY